MKHIKSMKDDPRMTGKKGIRLKVGDDVCEYVTNNALVLHSHVMSTADFLGSQLCNLYY